MNYYIQGDAAKADKIKAAFERKGYDVLRWKFNSTDGLYFSNQLNNKINYSVNEVFCNLIKTHPDYKELKLPVQPKFKVGDWIACDADSFTLSIKSVRDENYYFHQGGSLPIKEVDVYYHLWAIADAKDGDVLAVDWHQDDDSWEKIVIFKKYHAKGVKGLLNSPCVEGYGNTFKNGKLVLQEEVPYYSKTWTMTLQPATKEQRDLLFQEMKKNNCEWDTEKKELKKIQPHYDIANFKPFDKVLVRCGNDEEWMIEFYCKYDTLVHTSPHRDYPFMGIGDSYSQCIPFEGNEHLLGTTDPCDEEYINW